MAKRKGQLRSFDARSDGPGEASTDDRVRRSRQSVLDATLALLIEKGFSGVSVDEVCRRSGVAKTTIYRHWPTRSVLLIDACKLLSTPQKVPNTGDFAGDIAALMSALGKLLRTAKWTSVLPSVIDAGERDSEIAEVYARLQKGHEAPFREVIARAKGRGELSADVDEATLIALLVGPLFYRRWFSREALDATFVSNTVGAVVSQFASRPAR